MECALKWALYSFKSRCMSVTYDQLTSECEALVKGQARIVERGGHSGMRKNIELIYAENEREYKKIKEISSREHV